MPNDAPTPPTQDRMIAHALIEDIVEWRIPPGSWIREREIAERFGVSHAPVREAFRHIATIGFVQVVPWRGAHVIDIDHHAAEEVLELWKANYGVVCRLAAQKISVEDGHTLMMKLGEYKALVHRTRNTFDHLALSNRIGAFIARCSGARLASDMLDRVALFARWQHHVLAADYYEPEAGIRSAELYEALCRAIVAHQPDSADQAARALLGYLQQRFEQPLSEYLTVKRAESVPARRTGRRKD